jgi:hypothetical protein
MSPLRPTRDRDPLATLARTEAHLRAEAGARAAAEAPRGAGVRLASACLAVPGGLLTALAGVGFAQEHCFTAASAGAWCAPFVAMPLQPWMLGPGKWAVPLVALGFVVAAVAVWRHRPVADPGPWDGATPRRPGGFVRVDTTSIEGRSAGERAALYAMVGAAPIERLASLWRPETAASTLALYNGGAQVEMNIPLSERSTVPVRLVRGDGPAVEVALFGAPVALAQLVSQAALAQAGALAQAVADAKRA